MLVKKTNKSTMIEYRKTKVCHPVNTGDEFGPGEEWVVPYTLKVPVTCGQYVVLHHDILAGGIGQDGTVVLNTDGWKSPSLKDAMNNVVLPAGWRVTNDWFIVTPYDKYPVIDNMRINATGRLIKPDADAVDEWTRKLKFTPARVKWYVQHVMDLIKRGKISKMYDSDPLTNLESQIDKLIVSRYLPEKVSEKMKVEIGATKEFKDALEGFILVTLGLPFRV